jgi:hypothetical protein
MPSRRSGIPCRCIIEEGVGERAKAQLALADPAAALDTLDPARPFTGFLALAAEAAVLEAVAHDRLRQDSLAAERFEYAIGLAEPVGFRRP